MVSEFARMSGANSQLKLLMEKGLTCREAAESLGINPEAAELSLRTEDKTPMTVEEMINKTKPEMVKVLREIAMFGENESARVKAATVLLTQTGVLPEIAVDKIEQYFRQAKQAIVSIDQQPIVDVETSST